jgi:phage shock protein A
MSLLERVSTLIRANLNDLVDKAEDPEKMIKQVVIDMENQFLQVKTQVAIAMADQHVLGKKQKENEDKAAEWTRKADLALDKGDDSLARAALERALTHRQLGESFAQQVADQRTQVENLKSALVKLEQKLGEGRAKRDVLIAQHRRARAVNRAGEAQAQVGECSGAAAFDRMKNRVEEAEAVSQATAELTRDTVEEKFEALEKDEKVDRMLAELKARRRSTV